MGGLGSAGLNVIVGTPVGLRRCRAIIYESSPTREGQSQNHGHIRRIRVPQTMGYGRTDANLNVSRTSGGATVSSLQSSSARARQSQIHSQNRCMLSPNAPRIRCF